MRLQLSLIFGLALAAIAPGQAAIAEVKIGFANPLSGPFSESGERNRVAVEMAVEDLNARGGVLGEQVRWSSRTTPAACRVRSTRRVPWSRPGCRRRRAHVLPLVAARRRHLRDGGCPHDHPVLDPSAADRGGPAERVPPERARRRPGQVRGQLSGRPLCRHRGSPSCTTAAPTAKASRRRRASSCMSVARRKSSMASTPPAPRTIRTCWSGCGRRASMCSTSAATGRMPV